MNWLENFTESITKIAATAQDVIGTATSIASKIKGMSIPSITTSTGAPAGKEMSSSGQPVVISTNLVSQYGSYAVMALLGGVILYLILRK